MDSLEGCEGETVIIRSHGVGKAVYDELESPRNKLCGRHLSVCKKDTLTLSMRNYEEGKRHNNYRRRKASGGYGYKRLVRKYLAVIVDNAEEAVGIELEDKDYAVVVQTTFRESKYKDILKIINEKSGKMSANNTICSATEERQSEAVKISKNVDKMLVIGDKGSSNTQKLYEICEKNCQNTYYIETINDLVLNNYGI